MLEEDFSARRPPIGVAFGVLLPRFVCVCTYICIYVRVQDISAPPPPLGVAFGVLLPRCVCVCVCVCVYMGLFSGSSSSWCCLWRAAAAAEPISPTFCARSCITSSSSPPPSPPAPGPVASAPIGAVRAEVRTSVKRDLGRGLMRSKRDRTR
jgi:hypothetical protein